MKPFVPILLIVLSIGMFYLYINPHYLTVKSLLNQRAEYKTALANIEQVKQLRDTLETQYSELSQDDVSRLEKIIPQTLNTVKLTADMDALAGKRGMTLKNVRVSELNSDNAAGISQKSDKPYKTTTMTFSVNGSYPNFIGFLKDLEKSLQLIDVRTVNMKVGNSQTNIMQFDVTIQTYWIN